MLETFFLKLQAKSAKRVFPSQVFPCEFSQIFQDSFFIEHLRASISNIFTVEIYWKTFWDE